MTKQRGRTPFLTRRFGPTPSDYPVAERGFIGIQIDGLGYYVLRGALNRRYAPFLRKLVKRRGYRLHRYRVGLPATTPASQAAILYGENDDIPGFRWLEKETRTIKISKSSSVCAEVERRLSAHAPGILRHGSSYCNMFSADAESATLTLSRLGEMPHRPLGWVDLIALALHTLGLLLRILVLAFWETALELYDQLTAIQDGRPTRDEGAFPLVRVVTNVVFREIATEGALVDLYRGVPFIYLNFSGYDEIAHHRGPNSVYAKLALRAIDKRVRRLVRATERSRRNYDVILLSDHGMATTTPWEHLHGQSLTDFILEQAVAVQLAPLSATHRVKQVGRALAFATWLRELEWALPRRLGRWVRAAGDRLKDRLPDEATGIDWGHAADVMVQPTGSLAHVYFTSTPEPLTIDQIRARYGDLVEALIQHPSIAAVAARSADGGVEIRSANGALNLLPDGTQLRSGEHPLSLFIDGVELTSEVVRLAKMRHAGDLVLFSAKDGAGRVVNFQVEMGSHGGLHLEEQAGFVLVPGHVAFDFSSVRSVRDLYRLFAAYHPSEDAARADAELAATTAAEQR